MKPYPFAVLAACLSVGLLSVFASTARAQSIDSFVISGGGGGLTDDGTPTVAHYADGLVLYDSIDTYAQPSGVGVAPTNAGSIAIWSGYVSQDLSGNDFDQAAIALGNVQVSLQMSSATASPGGSASLILTGTPDPGVLAGGVSVAIRLDKQLLPTLDAGGLIVVTSANTASANYVAADPTDPDQRPILLVGVAHVDNTNAGLPTGQEWARLPLIVAPAASIGALLHATATSYTGTDPVGSALGGGPLSSDAVLTVAPVVMTPPPTAVSLTISTPKETAVAVTLSANDTDNDNDPLTFTILTQPAHGALSGSAPNLTYAPAPGSIGSDSFTYKANDTHKDSNVATVTISVVAPPPVAHDQIMPPITTPKDTSVSITLTATDPSGLPMSYSVVAPTSHGSLSGTPPHLNYTPTTGYTGTDGFTFKANNGVADSNTASVNLVVGSIGTITVQSVTGIPGGTAVVPLNIDSIAVAGVQLTVKYDPALTLADADVAGGSLFNLSQITPNTQTAGTAFLAIVGNKNVQGPGSIANLTFHIPASATLGTAYSIHLQDALGNDQTGKNFSVATVDGTVMASGLCGDVSGDGLITTADATLILRSIVHLTDLTPAQKAGADVNSDGRITTADVTLILRKIVHLIDAFPTPACQGPAQ